MPTLEPRRYLFLLNRPNIQNRRLAFSRARKLGLSVPAQYGDSALEIIAPPDKAEALFESGLFSSYTKKTVSTPHLERVPAVQRRAVRMWNERFSKESRENKKRDAGYGVSWGSAKIPAPAPYTPVDVAKLASRVAQFVAKQGKRRAKPLSGKRRLNPEKLSTEDRVWLEKTFRDRLKDETLAYHLIRTLPHLAFAARKLFFDLSWLDDLVKLFAELMAEDACWEMHGEISVGLVIIESSKSGGPKFSASKTDQIINEITAGLSWLVAEHPENDLSWVYDIQEVQVDVDNDGNLDGNDFEYDSYWLLPGMAKVQYQGNSYSGTVDDIDKYREDMRLTNLSRHSTVIFISSFGSSWHAYSTGGKRAIVMAPNHPNLNGDVEKFERIGAHEMCHKFGATDEYTGNGTPCSSCGGDHGCDDIPNGNCGECAKPHVTCVMHKREFELCQYTRAQIGWSDLFVELFTEDEFLAGTDDDVWLDIGDRTFVLDTPNVDYREAGHRNGYAIWTGGDLQRSAIKRVLIRKSSDSINGGWKLRRVRVFHQGDEICDESPHQWLEDEATRFFLARAFDDSLVNRLRLEVTTGTEFAAGTDDDVTLELAGREWNLDTTANDFENGQTNNFKLDPLTGLYVADIHTITIRKSGDGIFGGWLLKGLKLIVNGNTLYNKQNINKWLEDDDRIFTDAI